MNKPMLFDYITDTETIKVNELMNNINNLRRKQLLSYNECIYSYMKGLEKILSNSNKVFNVFTNTLNYITKK